MATQVEFTYDLSRFISFRDREACERVRRITRSELVRHPSPEFQIRIIDEPAAFYRAFAEDIVSRIRAARDHIEATRAQLAAAIVAEAQAGVSQVEIIRRTGYSRERVRTRDTWP